MSHHLLRACILGGVLFVFQSSVVDLSDYDTFLLTGYLLPKRSSSLLAVSLSLSRGAQRSQHWKDLIGPIVSFADRYHLLVSSPIHNLPVAIPLTQATQMPSTDVTRRPMWMEGKENSDMNHYMFQFFLNLMTYKIFERFSKRGHAQIRSWILH